MKKRDVNILKCATGELNLRTRRHNPQSGYNRKIKHRGRQYE